MRTFSTVAIFALALTGANAAVYTGDGAVTQSGVVTVGDPDACPTEYTSGASSIDVSYTGFPAGETVDIKLCFTADKIKERPWRKYVNNLEKNKQCWQTADLLKIFKKAAVTTGSDGAGSVSVELPVNVAPSEYTIMVYSKDADGAFTQWQDSKENEDSCPIKTKIYNNLPTSLVGVQAFFTVFSIFVLIGSYTYDRAKQAQL